MTLDCPSVGAMTVTMLTECANVNDILYEFSLVSMCLVVIELEYHLELDVASWCLVVIDHELEYDLDVPYASDILVMCG